MPAANAQLMDRETSRAWSLKYCSGVCSKRQAGRLAHSVAQFGSAHKETFAPPVSSAWMHCTSSSFDMKCSPEVMFREKRDVKKRALSRGRDTRWLHVVCHGIRRRTLVGSRLKWRGQMWALYGRSRGRLGDAVSSLSAGSKYAWALGLVLHPVALSGLLLRCQSRAFGCCCVGER